MSFHIHMVGHSEPLTMDPIDDLERAVELAVDVHGQYTPNYRMYEVREVGSGKVRFRIYTSDEWLDGEMWQRDYIERFE